MSKRAKNNTVSDVKYKIQHVKRKTENLIKKFKISS
jgi:hypothetical protein